MSAKHIVFMTGTRADYGKLKPLIAATRQVPDFEVSIFATGMHLLELYGSTWIEIDREGAGDLHKFINQNLNDSMDAVLGKTVLGFSDFLKARKADLVVVHGDRVEALAAAVVGVLQNVRVAHVEGGELSGTVDESLRHAISKLAHHHFVANQQAAEILLQMGETPSVVHVIGSPDIDVMNSSTLPSMKDARRKYEIDFPSYGILMFHPVTTEASHTAVHAEAVVDAVIESGLPFVVIFPNNDLGSKQILQAYERLSERPSFRVFPSIRFEYFLTILRHSRLILGNSSAGIREAPHYGVPSVDIGTRQTGRSRGDSVIHCEPSAPDILAAIDRALHAPRIPSSVYGDGQSAAKFRTILESEHFWSTKLQKGLVKTLEIDWSAGGFLNDV